MTPPAELFDAEPIEGAMWNGYPCIAVEVYALPPEHDPEVHPPLAWWKSTKEMTKGFRPAIAIIGGNFQGDWFIIDDENAAGLEKVLSGGGPSNHHRNLPTDSMVVLREGEE